jgi:hypothetical protein
MQNAAPMILDESFGRGAPNQHEKRVLFSLF